MAHDRMAMDDMPVVPVPSPAAALKYAPSSDEEETLQRAIKRALDGQLDEKIRTIVLELLQNPSINPNGALNGGVRPSSTVGVDGDGDTSPLKIPTVADEMRDRKRRPLAPSHHRSPPTPPPRHAPARLLERRRSAHALGPSSPPNLHTLSSSRRSKTSGSLSRVWSNTLRSSKVMSQTAPSSDAPGSGAVSKGMQRWKTCSSIVSGRHKEKKHLWDTIVRVRERSSFVVSPAQAAQLRQEMEPTKKHGFSFKKTVACHGGDLHEIVNLDESIWTVPLVIGTDTVGSFGSVFIAFLYLLNAGCQVLFCHVLINSELTVPKWSDEKVNELRDWRRNIAHHIDNYDRFTKNSLASGVCEGSLAVQMSTQQADIFGDLSDYLKDPPVSQLLAPGVQLCLMGLLSWYMTMGKEINSTINVVRAAWTLPSARNTLIRRVRDARAPHVHAPSLSMMSQTRPGTPGFGGARPHATQRPLPLVLPSLHPHPRRT